MTRIKAAVCHEFGKPLHVEDIDLRAPENDEIEVTLVPSRFAIRIFPLPMGTGVGSCLRFMGTRPRAVSAPLGIMCAVWTLAIMLL